MEPKVTRPKGPDGRPLAGFEGLIADGEGGWEYSWILEERDQADEAWEAKKETGMSSVTQRNRWELP